MTWLRIVGLLCWVTSGEGLAQNLSLGAPAPGLIESGLPAFGVLGPETLGLKTAPVDLQQMPDGRLLAVGHGELALGDGVRWEVFRQADNDEQVDTLNVAVDEAGRIFAGISGGFGQVVFARDARWRLVLVARLPPQANLVTPPLVHVAAAENQWLWWWGSGPVVAWRPGTVARLVGRSNDIERVFLLDGKIHVSDGSTGGLLRLENGALRLLPRPESIFVDQTITCVVPWGPGRTLVGTAASGALVSDGSTLKPLAERGLLAGEHRINDLCAIGQGFFAAAVDNVGVVFFDQAGRTVQVLDRSVDHRLSRVNRLLHTADGVVWALLNDGIAWIGFPNRVSNFEAYVPTGLAFAQPYRHDGRLWLLSDGRAQRGVYDEGNRLERFEIDTPPGYVSSMADLDGTLAACSTAGIFVRDTPAEWRRAATGPLSAYLRPEPVAYGLWLYAAENEVGWLRRAGGRFSVERFPVPRLGHVYGGLTDARGFYWVELGTAKVGRIDASQPQPAVEVFGPAEGVPDGWAQIFLIDGEARINVPPQILRLDGRAHRFVADTALRQRLPGLVNAVGRPAVDARDRLWVARQGRVHVYRPAAEHFKEDLDDFPAGLLPLHFSPQADGVMWMHQRQRLARYDPAMPVAAPAPLRAMITRIQFPNSNRTVFPDGATLPPLSPSDNALVVHFLAPNHSAAPPVTFEVQLTGGKDGWISTGVSGTAAFNRLAPGSYELRVRPRVGDTVGAEARLAFAVPAPWYRTAAAYVAYVLAILGAVVGAVWLFTLLQRRENARLERLVNRRTAELHESNARLASQVEEIQMLSQAIAQSPVSVLITRPDGTIVFANPGVSALTGYTAAELIGKNADLLRAPTVAPALRQELAATVRRGESWHGELVDLGKDGRTIPVRATVAPIRAPDGQVRLLLVLEEDITQWINQQERQRQLEAQLYAAQRLESIGTLAGGIAHDFNNILTGIFGSIQLAAMDLAPSHPSQQWLQQVKQASGRAKDLVNRMLAFSRQQEPHRAPLELAVVVREVLQLIRPSLPASIEIITDFPAACPLVYADSGQMHQIVMNLATNAAQAMGSAGRLGLRLDVADVDAETVRQRPQLRCGRFVRLTVSDTGCGMEAATLSRIFEPFFTTKKSRGGTGLGLSVVHGIIQKHDGALVVYSEVNKGSSFMVYLPVCDSAVPPVSADAPPPRRGRNQHIMLVDDEELVLQVAAPILNRSGYRTTCFTDPAEALKAFRTNPAGFAVVITDLTMPRLLGTELSVGLRSVRPDLPVILSTGFRGALAAAEMEAFNLQGPVLKPFSADALCRAVEAALSHNPVS